ncbi:MAG: CotH kinase family protein [Polyangiaceae bacterium]|nr:CotH kinase family protein [Polyangiaceae bacterium]
MNRTLVPLYHRMLRSRLVSERLFGQPRLLDRLLRIRPLSALILAAPALALCLWYLALAVASHYRHAAEVELEAGVPERLTAELVQLHLHDRLSADLRRLTTPEPTGQSPLPTYGLVVADRDLKQLDRSLPPDDGKAYYVPAYLTRNNRVYEVQVRYRGSKPWHWNYPQKSWKVRMKGARELGGLSTFNFINTPDPVPFSEQMMLDVAREQGLLSPDYFPVRLLLNRAYLGVYFFETQPTAGLLRRAHRAPGNVYSGSDAPVDPKTGVSALWQSTAHWKRVAAAKDGLLDSGADIEALINQVNFASALEFADFAQRTLDVAKFALFDALDVVFGNNQHDYANNHKLYFDPYRGRFEPIVTELRDTKHERVLNRAENPLLLRLKQLPSYLPLRDRLVYELLSGACSPRAMRARSRRLVKQLEPDQIRDPYWDAYEQLPAMGDYFRHLVRPMDRAKQARAAEARLREYEQRVAFVRSVLEHTDVRLELHSLPAAPRAFSKPATPAEPPSSKPRQALPVAAAIDVTVNGESGVKLRELVLSWSEQCRPNRWRLYTDQDLNDDLDPSRDRVLAEDLRPDQRASVGLELTSGVLLESAEPSPDRGTVRAVPEPRRYRFFVASADCAPTRARVAVSNLATGSTLTLEAADVPNVAAAPRVQLACADGRYRLEPGQRSAHPWCYPNPTARAVTLGPGAVDVPETRVFRSNESVTILPGTTFRLGEHASLVFYGRLDARGQIGNPIRFEPAARHWGGVALQGPGTSGSRLEYAELREGCHPTVGLTHFPGMLDIQDTNKVELSHVTLVNNHDSESALHIAYASDTVVRDSTFGDAPVDALAVDMSAVQLDGLTVANAARNGIDLRGAHAELRRARLVGCRGVALSADMATDLSLRDSLLATAGQGIVLQGSSTASLDGVLLYRNGVGARVEPEPDPDAGPSRLSGTVLYAVRCAQAISLPGRRHTTLERVAEQIENGALEALRTGVLGLRDWTSLDAWVDSLSRGEAP